MKAIVFAAGLGTRLRPLTDNKPKALVEVGGVTMLERVIRNLIYYGFNEIVVNVHHFGGQIIDFLKSKNNFGVTIHISDEREQLLDTGGGILKARKWLDGEDPVLIHNADILTDLNLTDIIERHKALHADATLLVAGRDTARYLVFGSDDLMKGWTNVKTSEIKPADLCIDQSCRLLAFGGVHVISPTVFDRLQMYSDEAKFSIINFYIDSCKEQRIVGYQPSVAYTWHDIGKIESLREAENTFVELFLPNEK